MQPESELDLENPVWKHRRELWQQRVDAVVAAIPPHITGDLRARCARYAAAVVRDCPEGELERVVWPWTRRPAAASVRRGRQGVAR